MYGYDEELPAGYQDADLEMAELEAAGNEAPALCTVELRALPSVDGYRRRFATVAVYVDGSECTLYDGPSYIDACRATPPLREQLEAGRA